MRLVIIFLLLLFSFGGHSQTILVSDGAIPAEWLAKLNNPYLATEACEKLADYYQEQKQFRKAIAYYDSADTKYRNPAEWCGNGYYARFIRRLGKIAHCYDQLGETDSAIKSITPYIFSPHFSRYFFQDEEWSAQYKEYILKKYSMAEARAIIEKAVTTLSFKRKDEKKRYDKRGKAYAFCYSATIRSSMTLLGTFIELNDGVIFARRRRDLPTIETTLEDVRLTRGYRLFFDQ